MIPDLRCVWCGELVLYRQFSMDELAVKYIVRKDNNTSEDKNAHVGDIRIAWHWKCACEDPLHEAMADSDADYFRAKTTKEKASVIDQQVRIVKCIINRIPERFCDLVARRVLESMRSRKAK